MTSTAVHPHHILPRYEIKAGLLCLWTSVAGAVAACLNVQLLAQLRTASLGHTAGGRNVIKRRQNNRQASSAARCTHRRSVKHELTRPQHKETSRRITAQSGHEHGPSPASRDKQHQHVTPGSILLDLPTSLAIKAHTLPAGQSLHHSGGGGFCEAVAG